ncbi:MAG: DinB family protein [Paludibacter sp.]|nr:DinB family protein [Paludibacter sp.]
MINKSVQPIKAQLELQNSLFENVLRNISEENAKFGLDEHVSSVKWLAGHIVNTRMTLTSILLGVGQDPVYAQLFDKGTSQITGQTYPTIDELLDKWKLISVELFTSIESLTEEKLFSPPPFQTSIPDTTLLGLIAFLTIHEAHHIGQISAFRKISEANANKDLVFYDRVICN